MLTYNRMMRKSLEKESAIKKKRADLKKIILRAVVVAGIIGVGLVAPNVLGAMKKLGMLPKKRQGEFINVSRDRLIANGFLKYVNGMLQITPNGEKYLLKETAYESLNDKKNKKWDGKWRVLIFDIPEKKKAIRERIRYTLTDIGFMRLQDSVWIYPYDCEDLITLLKADLKIGKDVLYMIVEELEYDQPVQSYFGFTEK